MRDGADTPSSGVHAMSSPIAREPFEIYVRWLYGGTILEPSDTRSDVDSITILIRACEAGHVLQTADFADHVVDELANLLFKTNQLHIEHLVPVFVQCFSKIARYRRLAIDWLVRGVFSCANAELAVSHITDLFFCQELAAALVNTRLFGASYQPPHVLEPCLYHAHKEFDQPCYRISRPDLKSPA